MEWSAILIGIFILLIDIFLIRKEIKNKLIFIGIKKFKIAIPIMILAFIILIFQENNFKTENIILCIEVLPLIFVGNKTGITEKGFLLNSYLTPWDKVEKYCTENQGNKYIVSYKMNSLTRKMFFKQEDKDEIKKYLSKVGKLRYVGKI